MEEEDLRKKILTRSLKSETTLSQSLPTTETNTLTETTSHEESEIEKLTPLGIVQVIWTLFQETTFFNLSENADSLYNQHHSLVRRYCQGTKLAALQSAESKRINEDVSWCDGVVVKLRKEYPEFILKNAEQSSRKNAAKQIPEANSKILTKIADLVVKTYTKSYFCSLFTKLKLNKRKITFLDASFASSFTHLKELSISLNKLVELKNIPESVEVLHCYGNMIQTVQTFEKHVNLQHLGLGLNRISSLTFLASAKSLLSLDLSFNNLTNLASTVASIKALPNLQLLVLKGNVIYMIKHYRHYIIQEMPNVTVLDEIPVSEAERLEAAKKDYSTAKEEITININIISLEGVEVVEPKTIEPEQPAGGAETVTRSSTPSKLSGSKKSTSKSSKSPATPAPPEEQIFQIKVFYKIDYYWLGELHQSSLLQASTSTLEFNFKETLTPLPSLRVKNQIEKPLEFIVTKVTKEVELLEDPAETKKAKPAKKELAVPEVKPVPIEKNIVQQEVGRVYFHLLDFMCGKTTFEGTANVRNATKEENVGEMKLKISSEINPAPVIEPVSAPTPAVLTPKGGQKAAPAAKTSKAKK